MVCTPTAAIRAYQAASAQRRIRLPLLATCRDDAHFDDRARMPAALRRCVMLSWAASQSPVGKQ